VEGLSVSKRVSKIIEVTAVETYTLCETFCRKGTYSIKVPLYIFKIKYDFSLPFMAGK